MLQVLREVRFAETFEVLPCPSDALRDEGRRHLLFAGRDVL
jgi:hypothetical protein